MTEPLSSPPEAKPPKLDAKAISRALLEKNDMTRPSHISVSRIIRSVGLDARYGPTGPCDARTVRSGSKAWICIDERTRGTPRARWSGLHELTHYIGHPDYNAIERIHLSGPKSARDHQIEREANAVPPEVLMPEEMFVPYCGADRPTLRELDLIGSMFGVSRQALTKRYAKFASAACAVAECEHGMTKWVIRSKAFRATAVGRRRLEDATFAAALSRGESVPTGPRRVARGTWGIDELDVEMTEHAVRIPESGIVLVWLWHAPA